MQPAAYFSSTGYQPPIYGQGGTYDLSSLKCSNSTYSDSIDNTFGNFSAKNAPSYTDTTFHQSGLLQNYSHVCYKSGGKHSGEFTTPDIINGIKSVFQGSEYILQDSEKSLYEQSLTSEIPADSMISKYTGTKHNYVSDPQPESEKWHKVSRTNTDSKVLNKIEEISAYEKNDTASNDNTQLKNGKSNVDSIGTDKGDVDTNTGDSKPTLSYIALIGKSILESPQKRLSLGSIYLWIEKHYPYYKNKGQGWRNSVRHNLSLNDCFIKAGRCEDGKGNYWAIHPSNIQDFMKGDFRQRRRSRRRGRKKDSELGLFQFSSGYLSNGSHPLSLGALNPASSLSTMYAPYTEAERRAYRLDEALLRQSMQNPLVNWYNNVACSSYSTNNTSNDCNGPYISNATQWQGYNEVSPHSIYPVNAGFSR